MFCKNCGFELSDNASFCKNCGSKIERIIAETFSKENSDGNQKKGKRLLPNILIWLVEILFLFGNIISSLLMMAVLSMAFDSEQVASSTTESFMIALTALAGILPLVFLVLFCIAIIYVCIKRNTKFLIKYMLPYVIILGLGVISAIMENEEISTDAILRTVIPITLAVVVKAIVNAVKKKKQI